ncbi:MAG TPA: ABC transporter ATP-binding protein [Aquifex aeolicus]|nr:ABC transporter ATP-binding protein [Aquifex aeolicus]
MKYFPWLFSLLKPYILLFLLSLVGSALQSVGATTITLLIKNVVDNVLILKNQEELLKYVILLLGSATLMQIGFFISTFTLVYISEKLVMILRNQVYEKLLKIPLNYFIHSPSGDLISRIVSDLESFKQVFGEYLPKLIREPFVVVALFGVLLYRDIVLTGLIFLLFPFMVIFTKYFSNKKKKHLSMQRERVSLLTSVLTETFKGIENIKLFLAEKLFLIKFTEFSEKLFKSSVKINLYIIGNTVINYIFGYLVVAVILFVGGLRIVSGDITTGDFISFLTALFMIQKPMMEVQKAVMNLKGSTPLFERILNILNLLEEKEGDKEFENLKDGITFKDVSVEVNGNRILKGINLAVRKGDKVGIKGHTGSGKSTFIKLIPRLIEYKGSIFLDEVELGNFKLTSLRKKIGFLSQEVILFRGTVRDNLLIANPQAKEEELIKALELARCDFVLNSQELLDMRIEEGGRNLSGGEKQRLAIARIFLKNPEIIILDEATSALDTNTEREVIDNLFKYFSDRTFFVVAHRPYSFKYCNLLIELEEGEIKKVSINAQIS